MFSLEKVDRDNFWPVVGICSAPGQPPRRYQSVLVAQAMVRPDCVPLAICEGGQTVGYIMYSHSGGAGRLHHIAVDALYQRSGHARRALQSAIQSLQLQGGRRLLLAVRPENTPAVALFESCGFVYTGGTEGYERAMVLEW